ncbi:mas-related G-protein coupled receptor member X4-like [Gracilinanus agilis]|uniref:mas-related G-protein coupled receptor member X4-like n=1 Tax=Gracilinanus agilis TaxID=191870 RepID=UPI001CFD7591|nr:mas-related G-protein coupled receptor member X4-like [Gracilinanus agilis]
MAVFTTPEQWKSVLDITMQTSTNSSLHPVVEAYETFVFDYVVDIFSLVIALVGLVGNSIVLWLLGFHIQRSPFSVYILNLAVSDALFLCTCFGVRMWEIVGDLNPFVLDVLGPCILNLPYWVSLSLLASISTERCLSVLFPIWYRCHRPKHTSVAVCAILWALSSLFWGTLVALYFLENHHVFVFHHALALVEFGWFALLTCVLCISSLTLVLRVQCSSQRQRPPRLYLLVLLAVLLFLVFGLPLGIIDAMWFSNIFSLMSYAHSRLLACVNSSANPFIYFFLGSHWSRRGREPLRVVLQRALGEEQEGGFGVRDTSHPNTLDKLS